VVAGAGTVDFRSAVDFPHYCRKSTALSQRVEAGRPAGQKEEPMVGIEPEVQTLDGALFVILQMAAVM